MNTPLAMNHARKPRAKTFTGCWTCRTRKVKCDLGKPSCQRCEKSNLECGGYDIKLRWTKPIKFDAYGAQITQDNGNNDQYEPQFQRRNIAFVRYRDEYEFYEDMDDELSALHSPPLEMIANNKTWIIKKFGVFKGTDKVKRKYVPRKKHKLNLIYKNAIKKEHKKMKKQKNINVNLKLLRKVHNSPSRNSSHYGPFDLDFSTIPFPRYEHTSNDLRDDVLSSAFELQGIPFSFPPGELPLDNSSIPSHNHEKENIDDFSHLYRLLFHKNDREKNITLGKPPAVSKVTPVSASNNSMNLNFSDSQISRYAMEVIPESILDSSIFNGVNNGNVLFQIPTTGLHVYGLTRFLLNYYLKSVADLMTVVTLPTNPWKKIYFPRALKALGDLAGVGYTSNSKNSLLNALLAVSCFNLQSKFPKNSPQTTFFLNLGIEFRSQASNFLKLCFNKSSQQEKYKDILTAILSMNSIDVVWGTMVDCQYHLTICEDFVEQRMQVRPKISEKARSLHRIFSFLKLIQDSTALDKLREKEIVIKDDSDDQTNYESRGNSYNIQLSHCEKSSTDVPTINKTLSSETGEYKELLNQQDGKIHIEFVRQDKHISPSIPIFNNITTEAYCSKNYEILSTDALYGLPNSLILLFSDCVQLVRHNEYYKSRSLLIPKKYHKLCAQFEHRLLNWESEWVFYREGAHEFISNVIEGVYHHTMSFYNSLIIYYFSMAKDLNNKLLQSYVEKVLQHLDILSDLIDNKGIRIVPLIWQGFIAGCACMDTNMQLSFKKWAAQLATSGMGSYWGARQIMFEVWRRRINGEVNDSWYSVYKDWEMNLMLS